MTVSSVPSSRLRPLSMSAAEDIIQGLRKWDLWGRLGWLEIKRRYRRTIIGPFWTSLSLLIFVVVLGSVGSGLLSKEIAEYLPFLVAGMVVWVLLSTILIESCSVLIGGAGLLRQKRFEYSTLAYALVWRNLIVFCHNMIVYFVIFGFYAPQLFSLKNFLAIPGLFLLLLNGIWLAILLGLVTLRFRDVQQLVQSIVQISMFVTPIFWPPETMSGVRRIIFVGLNPLYHLVSIVRDPLLGKDPRLNSYIAVLIVTLLGWTLTYVCFQKFRKRIPYWL